MKLIYHFFSFANLSSVKNQLQIFNFQFAYYRNLKNLGQHIGIYIAPETRRQICLSVISKKQNGFSVTLATHWPVNKKDLNYRLSLSQPHLSDWPYLAITRAHQHQPYISFTPLLDNSSQIRSTYPCGRIIQDLLGITILRDPTIQQVI